MIYCIVYFIIELAIFIFFFAAFSCCLSTRRRRLQTRRRYAKLVDAGQLSEAQVSILRSVSIFKYYDRKNFNDNEK